MCVNVTTLLYGAGTIRPRFRWRRSCFTSGGDATRRHRFMNKPFVGFHGKTFHVTSADVGESFFRNVALFVDQAEITKRTPAQNVDVDIRAHRDCVEKLSQHLAKLSCSRSVRLCAPCFFLQYTPFTKIYRTEAGPVFDGYTIEILRGFSEKFDFQ